MFIDKGPPTRADAAGPEVATDKGIVRGMWENGLAVFRGIPYAKAPVGALRFAAPVQRDPWSGVRETTEFGPPPPQPMRITSSDEWLTVNVWTPDLRTSTLPVMVWIYGGAFTIGSSDQPEFDGAGLAAQGIVVVSLNYRVGVEGFMQIEGAPSNRGLLDQIAALQWVSNNIPGFGGDPDNVTVFGQSAGAASIGMLLVAPGAAGLFHRGIAESVPASLFGRDLAADIATVIAGELGCRPTVAELTATSPAALVTATADEAKAVTQCQGRWGYDVVVRGSVFGPVIDGAVLPDSPWRALAGGMGRDVALLIGHNSAEYNLAIALAGGPGQVTVAEANRALRLLPPVADGAQAYRAAYPQAGHAELYGLVCSDFVYRMPSLHLAQSHAGGGGTTHLYEFRFDASPLGAAHTTEIPLVFGTLTSPVGAQFYGSPPSLAAVGVSAEIISAWGSFATNGDPGWPAYDPVNQLARVFDTQSTVARYPEQASQEIWTRYPFDPFPLQHR